MLLSIIIPVYNSEKTINRLIASITSQQSHLFKLDVVIINDGSNDNSKILLDKISENYSFINCFHTENQGVYKARNFALTKIKGDYIWMLDADDFISKKAFQILQKYLDQDLEVLNFGYYLEDNQKNIIKKLPPYIESVIDGITFLERNDGRLFLWNNIYSASFLKQNKITFLAKSVSLEDSLFNIEVFSKAKKVKYINDLLYTYCFNGNSISKTRTNSHLLKLGQSSLTVHIHTKRLRDEFPENSSQFKILNERLIHSVLGFFFSLLKQNYQLSYINESFENYRSNELLPIKRQSNSFQMFVFQKAVNLKWPFIMFSEINRYVCLLKKE